MTFQPINSNAVFLPTTIQYPKEPEELIKRLNKAYEDTATRLNVKQIGVFDLQEFLSGEQWFTSGNPQTKRQTFRTVYSIGAVTAGGPTVTVAHGITGFSTLTFTHIYGTGITTTPGVSGFYQVPLPYASAGANLNIDLKVDSTNIYLIASAGGFSLSSAIVVLEYLKN